MRWLCLILVLMLPAAQALAQDDDGTRLERLLENQLSDGEGFEVDLVGFRGALSSTASLDRLTIADSEGVWLILEDAQLNWTRSALLRGRLIVDQLTAERLQILRQPVPPEDQINLPPAEATPFSLPELPVSITIGEVSIAQVELGEPVIGIAAELSVEGSARLSDGEGGVALEVTRLDGPRGMFDLNASYANTTRELALDLLLEEDAGGLVADLTGLPGAPALSLTVEGSGPITDFTTNIALETDGVPRLTGFVVTKSADDTDDQAIFVDLSGDISPLILPDYQGFFGDDVRFASEVTLYGDGRIDLQDLTLSSAALSLDGDLALRADGQPERFTLTGRIADDSGAPVRLPIPDSRVLLDTLALDVSFDAAQDSTYRANIDLRGLDADDIDVGRMELDVTGSITEGAGAVSAVTATVLAVTEGVSHDDPALRQAIGASHRIDAELSWFEGAPVFVSDLDVRSGDLDLTGTAAFHLVGGRFDTTADLTARAGDLSRFAMAAGQPLSGAVTGTLRGTADVLSGAFDVTLDGTATDLRIADAVPPALLDGDTTLTISAARDETGLVLDTLRMEGSQLTLNGAGRINSTSGELEAELRLTNLGLFNSFVSGPATISVALTHSDGGPWALQADASGPQGIQVALAGDVGLPDNAVDLTANGALPLALANRFLAPRSVSGTLSFDLALRGQPALSGLTGTFNANDIRLSLPTLQTALEGVSMSGRLTGGRVAVDLTGNLASGGTLSADASVNLQTTSLPITAGITARNLRLIDPTLYDARIESADLSYTGAILGSAIVTGNAVLGESEIRVPETGLGVSSIPDIRHIGETSAQRQTRIAAGLIEADGGNGGDGRPIGLDITVTAPGRIFLRGRGLDAELGGTLRLGGTSANIVPAGQFELIRGRLSILGTRLDLTEGSATLQGNFDPFVRLLATSRAGGYTIGISVIGAVSNPEITFSSDPALPEDEVLAQLLFGRSVSALSPVQLLQLADAAASLAGGSTDSGILANLRDGLGLDDLDLQTDEEGNAAVRAGRYLSDNIYSDLTINADGETDLSLNIDLTPDITARGSFSSDGDSGLGLFFERDY